MSSTGDHKSIRQRFRNYFDNSIWLFIHNYIKNRIKRGLLEETVNDIISNNAKDVIYALFGLIFVSIIMYSFLITGKYNPENILNGIKIDEFGLQSLEKTAYQDIINDPKINSVQKIQQIQEFNEQRITNFQNRFQQIEQIDAVFISAITGAIALGGTLITQIWGRKRS